MKIGILTGSLVFDGNYSLVHDLASNFLVPSTDWFHKIFLVNPAWDRTQLTVLKERCLDIQPCFEDFQPTRDIFWAKLKELMSPCDVIISTNVIDLDEIAPPDLETPIVSLSICEQIYHDNPGRYGSNYKDRFHLAAVSHTARNAFPEHVRAKARVLYSGIDPGRITETIDRVKMREMWFGPEEKNYKIAIFHGTNGAITKQLETVLESIKHLPPEWKLLVIATPYAINIPEEVRGRVMFANPTPNIGNYYRAADCYILNSRAEGFSQALLEAWYCGCPTISTEHNAFKELMGNHPDIDFRPFLSIDATPEEIAKGIQDAKKSDSLQQLVMDHYMAKNMIDRWVEYLGEIVDV